MKIIFMGTPDFSVGALNALHDAGHDIVCVYTQPPRPAGRGQKVHLSAVHTRANALNIPVRHPISLKKDAEAVAEFKSLNADIAVVVAYGLILPQDILDAPKYGCLNIHASLLPRWRGAAPIQRAIMAGDDKTGICIMQMDAGLDTGDVLLREETPIRGQTTASLLHDTLSDMGARMIVETLAKYATLKPTPQPDTGITYAHMLDRSEGRIDWTKPAIDIERQLRALTPWPGVWTMYGDKRLKILSAKVTSGNGRPGEILSRHLTIACGTDALELTSVQPENKKAMDGDSFFNGGHVKEGDFLT